jgi:hypothetical protein
MEVAKNKSSGMFASVLGVAVLAAYMLVRMNEMRGGGGPGAWFALTCLQATAVTIALVSASMPRWRSYSRAVSEHNDWFVQVLKALLPSFGVLGGLLAVDVGLRWILLGIGPIESIFGGRRFALVSLHGASALLFALSFAKTRASGALLYLLTTVGLAVGFVLSRNIRLEHAAVSATIMYGVPLAFGAFGLWRLSTGRPFAREGRQRPLVEK